MNRRGLDSVVATILITLLSIIGVGILWAAVRPLISSTGNRVQPDCFTIDLDVASCVYTVSGPQYTNSVTIRRGVGNEDISAVKFVFSFANSEPIVTPEVVTAVNELETF